MPSRVPSRVPRRPGYRPAIGTAATPLERSGGPPRFISFEGVDGSGKSTQARRLAAWLRQRGVDVVEVREPGGTAAGEHVRELVLGPPGTELAHRTEALLFAAARAELVAEVIEPALAAGSTVIADRFVDSSLVYQGIVRGLGVEAVRAVNEFATGGLTPDRTVVIELPPDEGFARRRRAPDRIEAEAVAFHDAAADGYARLADADGGRIVRVDGSGDADAVAARVREALGV